MSGYEVPIPLDPTSSVHLLLAARYYVEIVIITGQKLDRELSAQDVLSILEDAIEKCRKRDQQKGAPS